MKKVVKSTNLYAHPFSGAYWKDAATELKDTRMLVITALMIALRVALKPLAIPLGPQLSIQTAMLATALGAMIFGPVMAIPAAIISDTVGFMLFPTGDYFLPFMLTEIASTVIYALFLYRTKVSATRVMLSRFFICFLVNILLQTGIIAWQYSYMGNPDGAKNYVLGAFTTIRIFKNVCVFPLESVVLTMFLKALVPITRRAKLTFDMDSTLKFSRKQIVALVCLVVIGAGTAAGYLNMHYGEKSRTLDYTTAQRIEENQKATQSVKANASVSFGDETLVCVVDSAFRPFLGDETEYTVSVYKLDTVAFAAGQAADKDYDMDTLWAYSKSGPRKDKYKSLIFVGSATYVKNEKTSEIKEFTYSPAN